MGSETDLIKERLDLAEIVGEYVGLKRAGQHFKGLCPFHQERTPSFIVSPTKGIWHCFGCGKGGDLFAFIQEKEGVDFAAALKMLAQRAGVELATQSRAGTDRRQRLFEVLALAARFYHEVLTRQSAGKRALEYLERERGVQLESLGRFQVGYAPHRWDTLLTFLRSRGYAPAEARAAGLASEGASGKLYDRFRGRIMFPIADAQGRVVAFGGRIVPWYATGSEGKYVNSPETELYAKRKVVYNLDRAKHILRQQVPAIVVEGYLDVIMLVQAGVENVVATSGTALTAEHVGQLARFTRSLHFAFDADVAGVKAALAATTAALTAGLRVATVLLPGGADPADLAKDYPERLQQVQGQPRSLVSVLFEQLQRTQSGVAREVWLQELLLALRLVSNPVQQGEMVQETAALLHVPEAQIIAQLTRLSSLPGDQRVNTGTVGQEKEDHAPFLRPEQLLLGLALISPSVRQLVVGDLRPEEVEMFDQPARSLYNFLQGLVDTYQQQLGTMSADEVLALVPPDLLSFAEGVRRVSEEQLAYSSDRPEAEGALLVRRLRQRVLEERLQALQKRLVKTDAAGREQALKQFRVLTEELAHLATQR